MADAEAALGEEVSREAAKTRRDDLGQRLDMLRRLMTATAQRDRIGARGNPKNGVVSPDRARARDVIARAGAIEDPLQDLWTAWSMKARGLPGTVDFSWRRKARAVSGNSRATADVAASSRRGRPLRR